MLQHVLPEIYLTEALAQHDRRVQDPAEASLFVMPSLTHVSWMLGDFDCCRQQQANPNCNWGRHQDRGMLVRAANARCSCSPAQTWLVAGAVPP